MSLKNFQYDALMRNYNQKQLLQKHQQDERIRRAEEQLPRLREIRREIAGLGLLKARLLLGAQKGDDFDLAEKIQALSLEKAEILRANGYPADYLDLHYDCPLCKDTGYIGNEKCTCFRKAAVDLLYTQSNIRDILDTENFAHFSFDYYSSEITDPATGITSLESARNAYDKAWDLIEKFREEAGNLFIYGETGVGKTYLTHCIAKELLDRSFFVLYFTSLIYLIYCPKMPLKRILNPQIWQPLSTTVICSSLMIWVQNSQTALFLPNCSAASMSEL